MKKFVLAAVTIAATGIGAWSGLRASSPETPTLSNLMLENIEALAGDDEGNDNRYKCYSSTVYQEGASIIVCSTCVERENATDALFCIHDWCYR